MANEAAGEPFDALIPPTKLVLPNHAHTPGSGTEPDWPPLEAAKVLAPNVTDADDWRENQTYIYGFALVRAGFFWEAHEVWEPVWLASQPNSRERRLLRALIQTANARLKSRMGRDRAADRLTMEASQELAGFSIRERETFMGVSIERFSTMLAQA